MRWAYLFSTKSTCTYTNMQQMPRKRVTQNECGKIELNKNKSHASISHLKFGSHMPLNNRKFFLYKYHPNEPFCFNFTRPKVPNIFHFHFHFAHWHYQYVNRNAPIYVMHCETALQVSYRETNGLLLRND